MRINPLYLLLPLAFFACDSAGADDDGDGLTNGEEEDLGTNPDAADTDGDGLDDGDEVNNLNTNPLSDDTDTDGLLDGEEVDLGTDPASADTDLDGLGDGDEVSYESDPLNPFSWPGSVVDEQKALWPDFTAQAEADDVDGDEYAMDEVLPNFSAFDRYDNEIELYQFYGSVILLDFSAGWCGPCRTVAQSAEDMFDDFRDDGFVIIHAMVDDNSPNGTVEDEDFTADWSDEYDLTFPVIEGPDIADMSAGLRSAGLDQGYIPYMIMLDQEMRLTEVFVGAGNEAQIERTIEDLIE